MLFAALNIIQRTKQNNQHRTNTNHSIPITTQTYTLTSHHITHAFLLSFSFTLLLLYSTFPVCAHDWMVAISLLLSGKLPLFNLEYMSTGDDPTPDAVSINVVTSNDDERPFTPSTRTEEPK
jgi:hypothetical protein